MKSLIIGIGEVGKALYKVLKTTHKTYIRDNKPLPEEKTNKKLYFAILHICFPYSQNFIKQVKEYRRHYSPKYTIIHSTVPVGTSRKCKSYHSPVRGTHPDLADSIEAFTKYLAPRNTTLRNYFTEAGIEIKMFSKPETTELLKILSTTYYAWNIVFCKEAKRICKEHNLDFNEVYTKANKTYNKGYVYLAKDNVTRPILKPIKGKISGHCLITNCHLLKDKITDIILKFNDKY